MHSWLIRGNAVLTLCTSVLAVVCIAVTLTGNCSKSVDIVSFRSPAELVCAAPALTCVDPASLVWLHQPEFTVCQQITFTAAVHPFAPILSRFKAFIRNMTDGLATERGCVCV